MENKSIVKICAITLGIFIIFAIIEISIKALTKKFSDYSEQKQEEKIQEEIYNSDAAVEEREVREYTKIICDAIEDKDYDYIWQALDETYKKYKFNDNLDELKSYIDNVDFGDEYAVTYTKKTGNLYQVMLGVTSGDKYFSKYFTIDVKEKNAKKFMFDEYTKIEELSEIAVYSGLDYEIIYYYNSGAIKAYVLKIKNTSKEEVKLEFSNTNLGYHNGKRIKCNTQKNVVLNSEETKNVEIYFNTDKTSPSYLELELNKNGEVLKHRILFSGIEDV